MASARLIRSASTRRVKILGDFGRGETEPLLGNSPTVGALRPRRFSIATAFSESFPEEEQTFHPYPFSDLPIYDNVWLIRKDVLQCINDPYTYVVKLSAAAAITSRGLLVLVAVLTIAIQQTRADQVATINNDYSTAVIEQGEFTVRWS